MEVKVKKSLSIQQNHNRRKLTQAEVNYLKQIHKKTVTKSKVFSGLYGSGTSYKCYKRINIITYLKLKKLLEKCSDIIIVPFSGRMSFEPQFAITKVITTTIHNAKHNKQELLLIFSINNLFTTINKKCECRL